MLLEEDWERIKKKWIDEGRIPDNEGYYHYSIKDEVIIYFNFGELNL